MDRKRIKRYLAGILVCTGLLAAGYMICLVCGMNDPFYEIPGTSLGQITDYLFQLAIYALPAAAIIRVGTEIWVMAEEDEPEETEALPKRKKKEGWFQKLLLIAAAVLWVGMLIISGTSFFLWELQRLLAGLWPLLAAGLAWGVAYWMDELDGPLSYLKEIEYYLCVFLGILAVQKWMITYTSLRLEPVETIFMVIAADMALAAALAIRKRERGGKAKGLWRLPVAAISNGVILFLLFRRHERVREILYSLGLDGARGNLALEKVDWLGFRMDALLANLGRNLSGVWKAFPYGFLRDFPLTFLNLSGGLPVMLAALGLLGLWLFLLVRITFICREDKKRFVLMVSLTGAFILKTALGIAAEAFLVTSSRVRIPILGNAADILPLIILLYLAATARPPEEVRSETEGHRSGKIIPFPGR